MILRVLVATALLFGLLQFAEPQRKKPRSSHTKNVSSLRRDLRRLRDKKAALQKELRSTKRETKAVVADIKDVDDRLESLSDALERTTDRLSAGRSEQADLAVKLKEANARLAVKKEVVQKRIARNYMQGEGSAFATLIRAENIGDFASRRYLISQIAEEDRRVFTEYKDLRADIAHKKNRQDALVHEISNLARNQREQQSGLKDARAQKGEFLGQLKSKEGQLEEMLSQFEEDERNIAGQIAAYSRRTTSGSAPPIKFSGRFSRPTNARITSGFGYRFHPILKIRRLHAGIDFGAPYGSPIRAAADGVVISAGYMRGFGNVVILDNGGGFSTVYGHCSRLLVHGGQKVARGQHIANVGSTGLSTGPHLHFEIRIKGRPVDPRGYV